MTSQQKSDFERGWRMGFANARAVSFGVEKPLRLGVWNKDFSNGFRKGQRDAISSKAMTTNEGWAAVTAATSAAVTTVVI